MKICAFVDPMGCAGLTPEDEYSGFEKAFRGMFKNRKIEFESEIQPYQLENKSLDIYVFDFGGMMPGCSDLLESQHREFAKAIIDHPNTLFIIVSRITGMMYRQTMEEIFPDYKIHNVIILETVWELEEYFSGWERNGIIKGGIE